MERQADHKPAAASGPTREAASSAAGRSVTENAEIRVGWRMAGLAFEVVSQVIAGAVLGWLYDRWRGSGSIGIMVGGIAGIAVGLLTLIRKSIKLNRDLDAHHPVSGRAKPLKDDEDLADDPWNDDHDD